MKLKKKGSIEVFVSSMFLTLTALLIILNMRLKQLDFAKNYVEDGLVASNLASATVDIEEYGRTHTIINTDFSKSYSDYVMALKDNLNLDDTFTPKSDIFIVSRVNIDSFVIYNIVGNDVVATSKGGSVITTSNGKGVTKTPDGVLITTTTVYSKISFKVKGFLDTEYEVFKEKSVDITN